MTSRSLARGRIALAVGGVALLAPLLGSTGSWASVTDAEAVSVSSAEVPGNRDSREPDVSGDGRFVAFASDASNLTSGDDNAATDIFLRDTRNGTTRMVSRATADASGFSRLPSVSDNGRFVAFVSDASNLVPNDVNRDEGAFLKDMSTGAITRVGFGGGQWVKLSGGGRYAAVDVGPAYGTYRYDRVTRGVAFVGLTEQPDISATGRFVVGLGHDNDVPQVLFTDMETGTTRDLLDSAPDAWTPHQNFEAPVISRSGRYVAFMTDATGLVSSDGARNDDVYLVDTADDTFHRLTPEFSEGFDPEVIGMGSVALSGNGRVVAFNVFDTRSDSAEALTLDRVTGLVSDRGGSGFQFNPSSLSSTGTRIAYEGASAEILLGSVRQCTISGTNGDDVLVGTNGPDVICGRGGDDVIEGRNGVDILSGGPGFDTVSFSRANSDVRVHLRFYQSNGSGVDELYGFQQVDGSPFDDTLRGSAGPDTLRGLGGDDRLLGNEGDDLLFGGAGSDFLWGAQDADLCDGGSGTDSESQCETLVSVP